MDLLEFKHQSCANQITLSPQANFLLPAFEVPNLVNVPLS